MKTSPKPYVARCADFSKEFATRDEAERWIARVEEAGHCKNTHEIIDNTPRGD